MKVYFSNYRNHWISPYTILERVLWWKDWDNISYDEPWVERWSDRLNPISVAIQWVLDKIHPRVVYVKVDRWDTWGMDHTLANIVLPMLKQLKQDKHGAPIVDDEDVPEGLGLRSTEAPPKENEWDTDDNTFKRWDWVLDQMIFSFEKKLDDDWDDEFWSGEYGDMKWEKTGKTMHNPITGKTEELSQLIEIGGNRTCNWAEREAMQKRISNGFMLFGKYYEALWD
jgi:hypothetical protein